MDATAAASVVSGVTAVMPPVDFAMLRDPLLLMTMIGVMLVVDLVRPRGATTPAGWLLLATSAAGLALDLVRPLPDASLWGGLILVDPLSRYFGVIFWVGLLLTTLMSLRAMAGRAGEGEYYALLAGSALGMLLLAASGELITLFVSLELLGVCLYLMAGLTRGEPASQEAGLKYLLIGAFSTALFLFGASLLYGVCGTTVLGELHAAVPAHLTEPMLLCGLLFVIAAVGFKVAAAPFHMWAPDVYTAAPVPMVAFVSTASKAAGFALAMRLLLGGLRPMQEDWTLPVALMAALTIVMGSFAAIPQTNIKRLIAYSSIAQAGYLLVGFVAGTMNGVSAVLYFLLVYLLTNLGIFTVILAVERETGSVEIADYAGLARRSPLVALAMLLFLLSLAGIPPLGGFWGKLYLFAAAMEPTGKFLWLVVLATVLTIVSLYYYLLVIRQMYIEAPKSPAPVRLGAAASAGILVCAAGVVIAGLAPSAILDRTMAVARAFLTP